MFPHAKRFIIPDISLIQAHKKQVPYTIIPIGGPEDLIRWRKEQALLAEAREAVLKPIRQATRDKAVFMVANQNADTTPDEVSKTELIQAKVRRGLDQADRGETKSLGSFAQYATEEHSETILAFIGRKISELWKSAFDNH